MHKQASYHTHLSYQAVVFAPLQFLENSIVSEDIPLSLGCLTWPTRLGLGGTCFALPDSISWLSALRELDLAKTTYLHLSSGLAECQHAAHPA